MYSKNHFIIFTSVILCFLCLPPTEAQDDTSRTITSLVEASRLIDQNNKLDPVKAIGIAWSNVPVAAKSDPDVIYCHALICMKHNVDSSSILARLSTNVPDDLDIRKSHIYGAFKDKGAVAGCNLINRYVRAALTNEKESEFTLWAVVMIETISRDEKIHLKLKPLLASPAYVAFKQNNPKLNALLENTGINFDDQQFNIAKTLDQQVTEANQILKNTTEQYIKTRTKLVDAITINLSNLILQLPKVEINRTVEYDTDFLGNTTSRIVRGPTVTPDPTYGFAPYYQGVAEFMRKNYGQNNPTGFVLKSLKTGRIYSYNNIYGQSNFIRIANSLKPMIIGLANLQTNLNQLDLNMQYFLRNFTLKYKDAIKTDAELSLAMNTWRQRIQQYNAQYAAIANLDKKQQVQENRTLKLLAEKLLPLIDFSAEKELEKFQVMQP